MSRLRIGFVGVGLMGHGMAANLLKAGHAVTVVAHRNRAPVDDLLRRGALEAPDLASLARGQSQIFICVATSEQVTAIVDGLAAALSPGQIVIDTGTTAPETTIATAARLATLGVQMADAPMGGGAQQAEAGELATLVGASPEVFAEIAPVAACYSRIVEHMGPVGSGHRAKLLNNLLAIGQAALVVEAYGQARDLDLDWERLYRVNMGGAARSGSLERILPPAIAGDYRGYLFSLANARKDIGYYLAEADAKGREAGLGAAVRQFLDEALARHGGELMLSELLDPARRSAPAPR